jgi:hypothetical protein
MEGENYLRNRGWYVEFSRLGEKKSQIYKKQSSEK